MNNYVARIFLCSTLITGVGAGLHTANAAPTELSTPAIHTEAPAFTLSDTNLKEHKLSDYKGKIVVLEWYNPGCPFVQKHYETKNMQALQNKFGGRDDIVWLSVVSSAKGKQGYMSPEEHNKQLETWQAKPDALLIDTAGEVGSRYGAATTPHMFVIDRNGKLVYKGAIDDKPTARKEDVEGSTNYVSAALEAILADKPVANAATKPYGCSVKY